MRWGPRLSRETSGEFVLGYFKATSQYCTVHLALTDGRKNQFRRAAWSPDIQYIYAIRNAYGKRQRGKLDWKSGAFQAIVDIPRELVFGVRQNRVSRLGLALDGKRIVALMSATEAKVEQEAQNRVVFLEKFADELQRKVPVGK